MRTSIGHHQKIGAMALWLGVVSWHGPMAAAANLDDIQQSPDPFFYQELSARIGCEESASWLALPQSGAEAFTSTLSDMKEAAKQRSDREDRSRSWYSLIKSKLFDAQKMAEHCSRPVGDPRNDGLSELAKKFPDGIAIIALGGFGSHIASEGTLTTSFRQWEKSDQQLVATGKVKFIRVECSFSYSPDETFCAEDMLRTLEQSFKTQDPSGKFRLLLWGYSKGGISAVEMLRKASWLRDRAIAVITAGTPFQGSVLIDRLAVAVDSFVQSSHIPGTTDALGADTIMKLLQMWIGGARADVNDIMRNFAKVREGVHSLTTKSRSEYLLRNLAANSFLRTNGSKIPVFQIAGIVDPSRMAGIPVMEVKSGKLLPMAKSYDGIHAAQLTAMIASTTKPLTDSCVALEDSLLPLEASRAAGLDPYFLTVLRMDHIGLRFHRLPTEMSHGVPDHAIVDAAIATIARRVNP